MILPQVEQTNLYNSLNPGPVPFQTAINTPATLNLLQTPLAMFRCPTDVAPPLNSNRPFTLTNSTTVQISTSNYPGVSGNTVDSGIFTRAANAGPVKIRDITDGTSNTLMVGERSKISGKRDPSNNQPWANNAALWAGVTSNDGGQVYGDQAVVGNTLYQLQTGISNTGAASPSTAFSSLHTGGVQFLLADGTVRFISENIQWTDNNNTNKALYGTLNKLCDRADGQVIGEF